MGDVGGMRISCGCLEECGRRVEARGWVVNGC